ncbi:MAG: replication initiator [Acidimicrobiales bacterium]
MNAEEASSLIRELQSSSNCSHPIRLRGELVNLATGEVTQRALKVACKDRREIVCPACSYLYRADTWILVSTGLVGGKGTPAVVGTHPRLFVTLTAPSFGAVHTIRDSGSCVTQQKSSKSQCVHRRITSCARRHSDNDVELGRPLCEKCFDYRGAVLWNAHSSRLWNNTIQLIRRLLAAEGGVGQPNLSTVAQLHYLKVAEVQRRGLAHFHCVLRLDGPKSIEAEPPKWASAEVLESVVRASIERASAPDVDGHLARWGRIYDIQDLAQREEGAIKVAAYVAKYAAKTTDGSKELARRFRSRRQIVSLVDDPHLRRLALTAWDLGGEAKFESMHLRVHANTFGFTGQLITKSRAFSTTFAALRSARTDYMAGEREGDPVEGTFHFEGRGYDDPRGTQLAEFFFTADRELREEARARDRAKTDGVTE